MALKKVLSLVKDKAKNNQDFIMKNLDKFVVAEKAEELGQLNQSIKDLLNKLVATTSLNEEQKKQISYYINEKNSWIKEIYDHRQDLSFNNGYNLNVIIFNIVRNDPIIKQYLEKEKITEEKFDVDPSKDTSIMLNSLELWSSSVMQELVSGNYENIVDKDKTEEYVANSTAHYFQSKTYQKLLNYFISPLKEEHLLAVLNSIYPQDNAHGEESNEKKLEKILEFKKCLDNGEQFGEVVKKCGGIGGVYGIQEYISKTCFEILHCHCYYYDMGEKGEDVGYRENNEITPKLYRNQNDQKHPIWAMKAADNFMYKKAQFISGSIQSFGDVGKIDLLDNQKKIDHGQEAADNLLLFNRTLKNSRNNTSSANNKKIEEVASKLKNLKPLTSENYYNAVQQIRST